MTLADFPSRTSFSFPPACRWPKIMALRHWTIECEKVCFPPPPMQYAERMEGKDQLPQRLALCTVTHRRYRVFPIPYNPSHGWSGLLSARIVKSLAQKSKIKMEKRNQKNRMQRRETKKKRPRGWKKNREKKSQARAGLPWTLLPVQTMRSNSVPCRPFRCKESIKIY